MTDAHENLLRRLAVGDEQAVAAAVSLYADSGASGLEAKHRALVRLSSLIAASATTPEYQWCIAHALAAGASDEEVVGVLVSVAPVVGAARVVAAAPDVARSLGYDLDAAFEAREAPSLVDRDPPLASGT